MGPELRSGERLKPTEVLFLLSNGCKRDSSEIAPNLVYERNERNVTDGHGRIKEGIGTTRVNSSVGQELHSWERLKPTEVLFLLPNGCKKAPQR